MQVKEHTITMPIRRKRIIRIPTIVSRLNNQQVLDAWKTHKNTKKARLLVSVREKYPELSVLSDDRLSEMFAMVVSDHQSKDGGFLEAYVESSLAIPFKRQVHIDDDGIVVKSGGKTIIDIVFGDPQLGTHISNYTAGSLKTCSRERWKLDTAWTYKNPPKLFLYITLTTDYPQPDTFEEGPTRKLICATPKKRDSRSFKLGFQDIESEVVALA